MKAILLSFPLLFFCGCLSPAPVHAVSYWLMEFRDSPVAAKKPKHGIARLSQVVVGQPYAGDRFVVLRQDGTVAFDGGNAFAAPPASLMKEVCFSALKASGLFSDVVDTTSSASAGFFVEVYVSRLALDCRQEDSRRAIAELRIRLLTGKTISATAVGDGTADASDGDYGVAFSKAVSAAVSSALSKMW